MSDREKPKTPPFGHIPTPTDRDRELATKVDALREPSKLLTEAERWRKYAMLLEDLVSPNVAAVIKKSVFNP